MCSHEGWAEVLPSEWLWINWNVQNFIYPSWSCLVPSEGPWPVRHLKHTINFVVIKWDLDWELAEERFSSSSSPWNIIMGRSICVQQLAWAIPQLEKDWHNSTPSWLLLVVKVKSEWVCACGGAGWLLEGSAVPICFVEKSALGCSSAWSGCIAKGKSLSLFTLCRDQQWF